MTYRKKAKSSQVPLYNQITTMFHMVTTMILILLPCNKGAKIGDYRKGLYWRVLIKHLEKHEIRKRVIIGAIDCIPLRYRLGDCIVLEDEMWRVKGYESYPKYDPEIIETMARCVYEGIIRVSSRFEKIYILVNVRLYYEAAKRMMKKWRPRNVVIVEVRDTRPGKFTQKIARFVQELAKELQYK